MTADEGIASRGWMSLERVTRFVMMRKFWKEE